MKLIKLVLCGSLILAPIGCASQRETLTSRPAVPVQTVPTADGADGQPVSSPEKPSHPIRDRLHNIAEATGDIIAAPFVYPVIFFAYAIGGMPKC